MSIDFYIEDLTKEQKEIVKFFNHLLVEKIGLVFKINHKIPFYYYKSWICYLNPIKDKGIELAFLKGSKLANNQGLLEARERKQVQGVIYQNVKEIDKRLIIEIIHEAIWLDEKKPYPSKRKK